MILKVKVIYLNPSKIQTNQHYSKTKLDDDGPLKFQNIMTFWIVIPEEDALLHFQ